MLPDYNIEYVIVYRLNDTVVLTVVGRYCSEIYQNTRYTLCDFFLFVCLCQFLLVAMGQGRMHNGIIIVDV